MTYKQIEASRERRLWFGQVFMPIIVLSATLASNPNIRNAISRKYEDIKQTIRTKKMFKKIKVVK